MNLRYLSLILSGTCLFSLSTFYLSDCNSQSPIEQNSNLDSKVVISQKQLLGITAKINTIAELITVRIDGANQNGSGVIVAKQGETYYVLTAEHVVGKEQEYGVLTPDNRQYSLDYNKIKKIPGADLAILQFTSQEDYQVATLANYKSKQEMMLEELSAAVNNPQTARANIEKIGQKYALIFRETQSLLPWIFLFGWQRQQNIPQPRLTAGRNSTQRKVFLAEENQPTTVFKDISSLTQEKGYRLSYTNFSQGGMSGGAVLDTQGRVIGIHTAAEGERVGLREIQLGFSLGIPIQTFLTSAERIGIKSEWLKVETSSPPLITAADEKAITESLFQLTPPTANARATDWINYGNELWRLFRYQEAITAFEEAIALQPNLAQAHYGKGISLESKEFLRELQYLEQPFTEEEPIDLDRETSEQALAAFAKTTELDPKFELAWRKQGVLLQELERYPEALAAYDKAIALNPTDDRLHYFRGSLLWLELGRPSEAVAAFTNAIAIKPDVIYYMSRSGAYLMLGNSQSAINDMNRVKELDPEFLGKYPF